MHCRVLSAIVVVACAAAAQADITPIQLSTPDAPIDPFAFAINSSGDIVAHAGANYYVKKHLGNVKYNDFTVPIGPGTPSSPHLSPDGSFSFLSATPSSVTITSVPFDGTALSTAPLTQNGSPIDPASFQPLPTNGSSQGQTQVGVRQSPHSSIIISTRLNSSSLGSTPDLTPVDGDFIGLSSKGSNIAYSYTSPGGGKPHIKILSDDLSQSNQLDLPQFSSVGTPVFAGNSVLFVSTTPGSSGAPPILEIEQNPLYKPSGSGQTNPLYTGSNRTLSIGTPAANSTGDFAFLVTDTDDNGLEQKRILHRDLATRSFLDVISTGDPLNGSTITDLRLSPDSLDDNSELLFYATLADGSSGLFLTSVPEPTTLSLLLAPLVFTRRRFRK